MKLSVVLPARNEEELIEKTLKDIYDYLKRKKYTFEILVVVNGSADNTETKVKTLSKKYSQIKLLKSKPGYGFALRKGMAKAVGDFVAVLNVDFYDFGLLDCVNKDMDGKDIIIGSKLAQGSVDKRPSVRRLISLLFNYYLKIFYGFKGTDTHGIKLIRHKVIESVLPKCKTESGIFDTEFILLSERLNFEMFDYPVSVSEKRPSRFRNRLFALPGDLYKLNKSLAQIRC